MNQSQARARRLFWAAALVLTAQACCARAEVIANSIDDFSGTQGQNGWYHGYRNVTVDAKGINYDPSADFLAFDSSMFDGTRWDLDSGGAAPWTELLAEALHPNGDNNAEEHWVIRRYIPSELAANTPVAITWNVRKQNLGGGNGVTGALHINGVRVQSATIAFNDATGVTSTYYLIAKPTDNLDLILSPVGVNGVADDGSDGSLTWMRVETVADSDSDGLPDPWEEIYFPGDLTKLSGNADYDGDGLTDAQELAKSTNPTKADTDDDGLRDGVETNTGVYVSATDTGTDPLKADADNDGRGDGDEVNGPPKTDPFDPDSDDDGYLDGDEVATGHDPNDPADNVDATAIAKSNAQFSGVQGQDNWYNGYRNYTKDGGGENYNPDTGFIAFKGGDGFGDWDGVNQQWSGTQWDLDSQARNPWTELAAESTHPNSSTAANPDGFDTGVQWTVRRWVATSLTKVTPLALRYHVRKSNTGGGNGVTGGVYINGQRMDAVMIAGNDGVGVTRTYFANVAPGDKIDVILSPRGADGQDADGADGSVTTLLIDPTLPTDPRQPNGDIFIPVGAGDTDADGLPDVWEKLYFPNDLTKLTANGDYDQDGLKDSGEYQRDSDPTKPDTDGDGLGDAVETKTGTYVSATDTGTDPKKADTDGDGLSDAGEVQRTPPTNPNKVDTDADGFTDPVEIAEGTDPIDPNDNPLTFVIANSQAEFSGVQGQNGWYYGYRVYEEGTSTVDYDPNADFVAFDDTMWNGGAWDIDTGGTAPWTYLAQLDVHPNGSNNTEGGENYNQEQWPIRRWVASELTGDTPVTLIWRVRKTNLNNDGVTGFLFVNGKQADSLAIAGNDGTAPVRRYRTTLKQGDIVDLALSPRAPNGQIQDWSDGSETWFWVDTRKVASPVTITGFGMNAGQNQFTLRWASQAGAKYTVEATADFKSWTKVATGLASGGAETSYTETLATPAPAYRVYRILTE